MLIELDSKIHQGLFFFFFSHQEKGEEWASESLIQNFLKFRARNLEMQKKLKKWKFFGNSFTNLNQR